MLINIFDNNRSEGHEKLEIYYQYFSGANYQFSHKPIVWIKF